MPKFRLPLLNSLRAFEAAARHQSMKKAGDELNVSAAAVSRQIRNIELQLGRPLFERYPRQVVLTDAGSTLLAAVTTGFAHIQRAFMQLRSDFPDRLVISVDPDFAGLWLVPRLGEFYATVPHTFLEIRSERMTLATPEPPASVSIQYAEAGIASKNVELLFRSRLFPVCTKSLAQASPLRSPQDLSQHVLLHDRSTDEWEEYLLNFAPEVDINLRQGIVFSETALCLEAAARGQGIAMGDDFLAANHLRDGRLIRPLESEVFSKNAYYWVAQQGGTVHPSIDAFRAWLRRTIETMGA